ncbi:hypothetical protein DFH27DRAFT_645634 [Peziza echinospora]|nr:hypothetical protein DFH27DRAFT_645634 [Peziza echinospora]
MWGRRKSGMVLLQDYSLGTAKSRRSQCREKRAHDAADADADATDSAYEKGEEALACTACIESASSSSCPHADMQNGGLPSRDQNPAFAIPTLPYSHSPACPPLIKPFPFGPPIDPLPSDPCPPAILRASPLPPLPHPTPRRAVILHAPARRTHNLIRMGGIKQSSLNSTLQLMIYSSRQPSPSHTPPPTFHTTLPPPHPHPYTHTHPLADACLTQTADARTHNDMLTVPFSVVSLALCNAGLHNPCSCYP